jgi:hypothetical protein
MRCGRANLAAVHDIIGQEIRLAEQSSYPLDAGALTGSYYDDFRLNGRNVYFTDIGPGAIVVLNLDTGALRRTLDGDPSTKGHPADDRGRQGTAAGVWPRANPGRRHAGRSRSTGAGCTTSRRPDRCRASRRDGSTIARSATPNGASTSSPGPTPRRQAAPRSMPCYIRFT